MRNFKIISMIYVALSLGALSVVWASKNATQTPSKEVLTTPKKNSANKESAVKKYNPETCSFPKDDDALKKLLTPEQYAITKKNGTERPFANEYHDNKHPGIYVDIISQEPLFSSLDKFDSGSGWPSFTKPLNKAAVVEKKDTSHGMTRVEIRSSRADSHLGHVFDDGPRDQGGLRYCMNSGSLRFIPLEKMKEEGYEDWLKLFSAKDLEKAQQNPYKGQR